MKKELYYLNGTLKKGDHEFHQDYVNSFCSIGLILDADRKNPEREIKRFIVSPIKKYFEKYPQFVPDDLSKEVRNSIKSLDKLVEVFNDISVHEDQREYKSLIKIAYDQTVRIFKESMEFELIKEIVEEYENDQSRTNRIS